MKILLLHLLALAALTTPAVARQSEPPAPQFTREQLRQDLTVARRALEEGHSGLYRYTPRAEIDRAFDAISNALGGPMDAAEFYRRLAPIVGVIKDGHTWVALPEHLEKELSNSVPLLPLLIRMVDGKPYVFRDFSTQNGRLKGMELRAVNGVPAARLILRMLSATRGDGDIMTGRLRRIDSWRPNHYMGGWEFNKHLVGLLGLRAPYRVSLWDEETKREEQLLLEGATLPTLAAAWKARFPQDQPSESDAEFTLHDEGRIARLSIRTFAGPVAPGSQQELPAFLDESFERMRASGTKALILDLRGNTGGGDAYGRILLSYFVTEPFRYYDDLIMNKLTFDFTRYVIGFRPIRESFARRGGDGLYHAVGHENWGVHQPSAQGFSGKVFVITDGLSFSTTSEFLSHMHYRRRATFIGEEAGGGYYGNTSGFLPVVTLPNTKVRVRVPLITYFLAVKGSEDGAARGVMPDYPVAYTITELLAGRDKEFALALELARRKTVAP